MDTEGLESSGISHSGAAQDTEGTIQAVFFELLSNVGISARSIAAIPLIFM